jgi:predicted dehydrogenase
MARIRIGILGLSPGQWAANAHLPYLQSVGSKFDIVAVCNSSVESAQNSINALKLDPTTKAYGNPQGMVLVGCLMKNSSYDLNRLI